MKIFKSWNFRSFTLLLLFLGLHTSYPVTSENSNKPIILQESEISDNDTEVIPGMACFFEYLLTEGYALYQLLPDLEWPDQKTHTEDQVKFPYLIAALPEWHLYPPGGRILYIPLTTHYKDHKTETGHGPPKQLS